MIQDTEQELERVLNEYRAAEDAPTKLQCARRLKHIINDLHFYLNRGTEVGWMK